MGRGGANAPGMAHSAGKGAARGGGSGFGHASVGNPGHNALSTLSSHSQHTSDKGETHDGRSFSSHSHSTQSLAQHQTDHSKKADQVVEVEDRGPGKEKGFVDSLPPGKEQQAGIVTLGLSPSHEVQPDRGLPLNLETIHSDLEDIVIRGLKPGQELQADPGGALNPSTNHSDLGNVVTLGRPPGQDLQPAHSDTLNLETIHSNLDDIATRGLAPGLELNLGRGKSLPASWQAKVTLWTSVPDTDDTYAIVPRDRWELGDDHTKILTSTNPELEDDDANPRWKLPWRNALVQLVPSFAVLLLFVSWIVKNGLTGHRIRKRLRSNASPDGARSPALDKFAAAFSTGGEPQQKAADEKLGPLLEHSPGDLDVERARAEIEHAQEIEETFDKNFNGIGLS